MKNRTKLMAASALSTLLMGSSAFAVTSLSSTATATVVGVMALSESSPLTFGSFTSSATPGTINSYGQVTGGVTSITLGAPALFNVVGVPGSNFSIVSPASVVLVSGNSSMRAALSAPTVTAMDGTGRGSFNETGILSVAANQPSGNYVGTYNVTVHY